MALTNFCCYSPSFVKEQQELQLWKWLKFLHYGPPLNKALRLLPVLLNWNEVKHTFKHFAESEYSILLSQTAQDCVCCQAHTSWPKNLCSRARRFATAWASDIYLENFMYQRLGLLAAEGLCSVQSKQEQKKFEKKSAACSSLILNHTGRRSSSREMWCQKPRAPCSSGELHSIHHSAWTCPLSWLPSCGLWVGHTPGGTALM